MKNVFEEGHEITLMDALDNRENRVSLQKELLERYPTNTLISLKMNIPGPIKTNNAIRKVFHSASSILQQYLVKNDVILLADTNRDLPTGPEGYFIVDMNDVEAKALCIKLEDDFLLSSMVDLDVYTLTDDGIQDISRQSLNIPPRKCFVCQNEAKACARSKQHTLKEIQQKLVTLYTDYYFSEIKQSVAQCAQKALLYEVTCTPKPGLVDAMDSGSHDDMTIYTFINSSCVLTPFFASFFEEGYHYPKEKPSNELFTKIRPIGIEAEKSMNEATQQVNTHKGAIFSLGVLMTALGYAFAQSGYFDLKHIQDIIKDMLCHLMDDFDGVENKRSEDLTIGERLFLDYGISGIRGEASSGYSIVFNHSLPYLVNQTTGDINDRMIDTLLFLLKHSKDTNLIKRAGTVEILDEARQSATDILAAGGVKSNLGRQLYLDMICEYKERNLSIGGTADLLIMTLCLYFIEQLP
ncbi:triphosphoribosyl-dephospho-CoA synthase CitG [Vagococcus sp. CY53-2]|uniref:triphosphoribosyl-dephospho-CoA synthase CitG n=1 Tax=Vagococcus sp. CY53-2 TaxID=2925780 RepID=UPI001F50B963|nr:triphosphoribosyl-dephospho-CoA synthase CitG [Vagococcus sp. CY53-2]MCI0130010.1 triphosphoribosyl-dephospho-CoA synthase CitG [Vagococcus sp. CY53-2]